MTTNVMRRLNGPAERRRAGWTKEELQRIAAADELQIAPQLTDGTLRDPVTIWVVAVDGRLFVRSAYGANAAWGRAARHAGHGRIRAGGMQTDATFVDGPTELNDAIDAAYRAKYCRYTPSLVQMMVTPEARATTLELTRKEQR